MSHLHGWKKSLSAANLHWAQHHLYISSLAQREQSSRVASVRRLASPSSFAIIVHRSMVKQQLC